MVIVFGRNQVIQSAISADRFPIDPSLPVDLSLTDAPVQQSLDRRSQMRLQNVHPSYPHLWITQMGVSVRSVAVFSNLYWKMSLAGWGIFKWPQAGYFGWPSGPGQRPSVQEMLLKMEPTNVILLSNH
jgi:hypothetical protein